MTDSDHPDYIEWAEKYLKNIAAAEKKLKENPPKTAVDLAKEVYD